MLKNIVRIEFQIVDRVYHFLCDADAPIEHIKEALFKCQHYVGQIEDQIKAKLAEQEAANTENKEAPAETQPESN